MARLTPQVDEDNQEQKTAQQKPSTPAQNRNKEGSNKKKGGKTKNGLTKGQDATKCQDGGELATKPEHEVKPTGDSTKKSRKLSLLVIAPRTSTLKTKRATLSPKP